MIANNNDSSVSHAVSKSCSLKGNQKLFFLHVDSAASCCKSYSEKLSDHKTLDNLLTHWHTEQHSLTTGNEIASCEFCWKNERLGARSYRQMNLPVGNDIDIYLSNVCNQMCSYCSAKLSSVWQQSMVDHGPFEGISKAAQANMIPLQPAQNTEHWLEQLAAYIQQQPANTVSVKLLGGEPLMQFRSLEKFVKLCYEKVREFRINTNLNPPSNKFLIWLVQHVPAQKLMFDVSLDATPSFNHVPRAGFDADRFLTNLEFLRNNGIAYHFLSLVSVLSIFDAKNFEAWAHRHDHRFRWLPLNNPDCLDVKWLPEPFRQQIDAESVQEFLPVGDVATAALIDLKLKEQYNYVKQYLQRANIDPMSAGNSLFAEYWIWLENKFK